MKDPIKLVFKNDDKIKEEVEKIEKIMKTEIHKNEINIEKDEEINENYKNEIINEKDNNEKIIEKDNNKDKEEKIIKKEGLIEFLI